jgi:hypothetical protein
MITPRCEVTPVPLPRGPASLPDRGGGNVGDPLNMISEETKAEIRSFIETHIGFTDRETFEGFVGRLFDMIAGEIANALQEERCWFLKRIGRPCRQ